MASRICATILQTRVRQISHGGTWQAGGPILPVECYGRISLRTWPATRPAPIPSNIESKIMWPDRRVSNLLKTEFPIVLAPMAGVMDADLVVAVAQGGGLGSLPCATLSVEKAREQVNIIRQRVSAPGNMNFFCHKAVDPDPKREAGWKQRLASFL